MYMYIYVYICIHVYICKGRACKRSPRDLDDAAREATQKLLHKWIMKITTQLDHENYYTAGS